MTARQPRSRNRVAIIGAGLTGCTVAYELAQQGVPSVVIERDPVPGGLIRSDRLEGVLYEPHGSHVFHTDDQEVWELANRLTPFLEYRHRVEILIEGRLLHWPILVSDIELQSRSADIRRQLAERRTVSSEARDRARNFEEWCIELMGPLLYERYVKPYTEKQWGKPPSELPAVWAPRRIDVRWDDDPYLFKDRFQGWPAGKNGYTGLIDALLDNQLVSLVTGSRATLETLPSLVASLDAAAVVLTCPLDELCGGCFGALEWRGVDVRHVYIPHVDYAQRAMVVNYPGAEYPFIRIHETKHASGQECRGTVLGFEFTGAPGRHYPIESSENKLLNKRYQEHIKAALPETHVFFSGRLGEYLYLDMDECMRMALDTARHIARRLVGHRSPSDAILAGGAPSRSRSR